MRRGRGQFDAYPDTGDADAHADADADAYSDANPDANAHSDTDAVGRCE